MDYWELQLGFLLTNQSPISQTCTKQISKMTLGNNLISQSFTKRIPKMTAISSYPELGFLLTNCTNLI